MPSRGWGRILLHFSLHSISQSYLWGSPSCSGLPLFLFHRPLSLFYSQLLSRLCCKSRARVIPEAGVWTVNKAGVPTAYPHFLQYGTLLTIYLFSLSY